MAPHAGAADDYGNGNGIGGRTGLFAIRDHAGRTTRDRLSRKDNDYGNGLGGRAELDRRS